MKHGRRVKERTQQSARLPGIRCTHPSSFRFDVTIDGVDAIFIAGRTDVLPIPTPDGNLDAFILKRHNFLVPEFTLTEELPPSVPIAEGAVVRVVSRAIGGVSFFQRLQRTYFWSRR